ncbi:MAG: helix-turn-helix transcriptional regulator [Clostridia bacterium]|nr:helix-turn-helix transcriptional regulator [Clostridia bacterium]MBQ3327654.1 helix-turn-helix transcriptional regulator [Clostridia bacterium]MBQ5686020.1 helix-turn-helix transcriptional regulator [Clostridia bacterium]MBQ6526639.1 helix-turn-helix transcriptional regulator [Clostridia bacterium]MBQ6785659.1 helix-turn-helix transcriptional regulator [Clostridia bacterium]
MQIDYEIITERIISIRKESGLNQEEFYNQVIDSSYHSSTAQGKQSKLENGKVPSLEELVAIADYAHITIDELVRPKEDQTLTADAKLTVRGICKAIVQIYESTELILDQHSLAFPNVIYNGKYIGDYGKANALISEFVGKLHTLADIHKNGTLPDDSFQLAINGHLATLPDVLPEELSERPRVTPIIPTEQE